MAQNKLNMNAILLEGRPVENRVIHINIEGILATDGSSLNGPITSHFTTEFNPFYSNFMRVRIIAGEFLGEVPDDTINQLVHYFSREADLLNYCPENVALNQSEYANYRSRWVTAMTAVTLLSGTSINGDLQKRLGDLSISRSRAAQEILNSLRGELGYLTSLLEDGGNFGRGMETVSKSSSHPDAPILSRGFARADIYGAPERPGANIRAKFTRTSDGASQNRWKKTWGRI